MREMSHDLIDKLRRMSPVLSGRRSRSKSVPRPGMGHSSERESKISVGMTYATPERAETYSAARLPLFALQELGGWESSEKFAGMHIS